MKKILFLLSLPWLIYGCKDSDKTDIEPEPIKMTSITLNKNEVALKPNQSFKLSATITPDDAANKDLIWKSSDALIASVTQEGLVEARQIGKAIITVTNPDSKVKATSTIEVSPVDIESIVLNKTSIELQIGASATLNTTIEPAEATNKTLIWSVSNAQIASISPEGLVTGLAVGKTMITVSDLEGKVTSQCEVSVLPVAITKLTLNKTTASLLKDDKVQLQVVIEPTNATDKSLIWETANPEIVSISENGLVTGLSIGSTMVTVRSKDGLRTTQCAINVADPDTYSFLVFDKLRKGILNEIVQYFETKAESFRPIFLTTSRALFLRYDNGTNLNPSTYNLAEITYLPEGNIYSVTYNYSYNRLPNADLSSSMRLKISFFDKTWSVGNVVFNSYTAPFELTSVKQEIDAAALKVQGAIKE